MEACAPLGALWSLRARPTLGALGPLITYMPLIASISRCPLEPLRALRALDSLIPLWSCLTYETPDPLVAHDALRSPLSCYTLGS